MRIFQESPRVNGGNRFIFQWSCSSFFSRAIDNGLKTIQTDKNLDRYIDRLSASSRPIYRTAIFWLSTECRLITDRYISQVSTNYRRSVGKSRQSVGERKAISAETHLERLSTVSRPSVDRLSTDYRPLYRPIADRLSTEYRPSVDRVSIDCRPSITDYRPSIDRYIGCYIDRYLGRQISRSTLPTVKKIQF